jgi:hypothetical protein
MHLPRKIVRLLHRDDELPGQTNGSAHSLGEIATYALACRVPRFQTLHGQFAGVMAASTARDRIMIMDHSARSGESSSEKAARLTAAGV